MATAAIITGVLGLLASLAGVYFNYQNTQSTNATNTQNVENTNQAQIQLAREQRQSDIEMWERQVAYQDPAHLRSLDAAAGINPNLRYMNGSFATEAPSAPATPGAQLTAPQIQAYQVDPMMMAQVANLRAQTDKTDAETAAIQSKLPEEVKNLQEGRRNLQAQIDKLNSDMQVNVARISQMNADEQLSLARTVTEAVNQRIASNADSRADVALANDLRLAKSQIDLNNATADVQRAVRNLDVQKYHYLEKANVFTLLGLEWDNQIKKNIYQLGLDEHSINGLNKTLLGYEVNAGRIDDWFAQEQNAGYYHDPARHLGMRFVKSMEYVTNKLFPKIMK